MKSIVDSIAKGLGYFLAVLLSLLVILTLWQVFSRYILGTPDPYSEEIIRIILMWFAMLAGAYCVHQRAHVGISILIDRTSLHMKKIINIILRLSLGLFAAVVFIYGGLRLMTLTLQLEQKMPVLGFPVGAVYAVMPISGVLILLFLLVIDAPLPEIKPDDKDHA